MKLLAFFIGMFLVSLAHSAIVCKDKLIDVGDHYTKLLDACGPPESFQGGIMYYTISKWHYRAHINGSGIIDGIVSDVR